MDDWDVITFGVQVGAKQFGPLRDSGSYAIRTGGDIDFTKVRRYAWFAQPALGPPDYRFPNYGIGNGYEIGPIEVADTDVVTVNYGVVNLYQTLRSGGSKDNSATVTKVALAVWTGLVGLAVGGPVGLAVSVIESVASAFFNWLPGSIPNCDGAVGGNKLVFTGSQLSQQTNNPQQRVSTDDRSGNPDAPSGCNRSDIVTTISVTAVPIESVKDFLILTLGGATSLKGYDAPGQTWAVRANIENSLQNPSGSPPQLFSGHTTSIRYIIENWDLLVPWGVYP